MKTCQRRGLQEGRRSSAERDFATDLSATCHRLSPSAITCHALPLGDTPRGSFGQPRRGLDEPHRTRERRGKCMVGTTHLGQNSFDLSRQQQIFTSAQHPSAETLMPHDTIIKTHHAGRKQRPWSSLITPGIGERTRTAEGPNWHQPRAMRGHLGSLKGLWELPPTATSFGETCPPIRLRFQHLGSAMVDAMGPGFLDPGPTLLDISG